MFRMCYLLEVNSSLGGLFEQLDDYGYNYECEEYFCSPDFLELYVECYEHEKTELEQIIEPYL